MFQVIGTEPTKKDDGISIENKNPQKVSRNTIQNYFPAKDNSKSKNLPKATSNQDKEKNDVQVKFLKKRSGGKEALIQKMFDKKGKYFLDVIILYYLKSQNRQEMF